MILISVVAYSGMGKVQGASLWGGNLRGVVRGMRLLVRLPMNLQFTQFRCFPKDAWNVASDQLECTQLQMYPPSCQRCWTQHMVILMTVVLGHKNQRKNPYPYITQ